MLMLRIGHVRAIVGLDGGYHKPHPFADRESLERQVLGILKDQIAKIEDGSEPE